MKAGKYYVGDLCYVMNDDLWSDFCDAHDENDDYEFDFKGNQVFTHYTAWGDGYYRDQFKQGYAVDSGTIGCISINSDCINLDDLNATVSKNNGMIIEFKEDFKCDYRGGTFKIGHIKIETDDDDEFDDEEY